jgi:NAD(P)-dependent dehydrogenase (short-subunit alcohol dehydrogenase family)
MQDDCGKLGADSRAVPPEFNITVEIEKVAKLASYLCTDAADIINGAALTADGGWTAN